MANLRSSFRALSGIGGTGVERYFAMGLLVFVLLAGGFVAVTGKTWRRALPVALERVDARIAKEGRTFTSEDDRQHLRLKAVKAADLARTCLWWAALVNAGLAGGLLLTRRFWAGPVAPGETATLTGDAGQGRQFVVVLGVIVLGALALRAPRMGLSLYNDEAFNFTRYIHGQFKMKDGDPEAEPRFVPVAWSETLWSNHQGNNGVLYSLLARACHDGWSAATGAVDGEFREWPLRLPALVPGLLSIGLLGLLGARLGGNGVGWAVAVVAAAHPWHVRYCTEGRPYGLVLFGVSLALYALCRGLEDGRWRWWLLYGFALFVALGAFVGAAHFAVGLNAVVFVALVFRWLKGKEAGERGRALRLLGRLVAANVMAAMLYLQVLAPILPQMKPAVALMLGDVEGVRPFSIVPDVLSYLATGMPWEDRDPENALNPSFARLLAMPALGIPVLLALGLVVLAGMRALCRTRSFAGIAVLGGGAALVSALAASALTGIALHRWYLIHALPAAILLLGLGVWALARHAGKLPRAALALAPLLWFAAVAYPNYCYAVRGKEDLLGITLTVRGGRYPFTEAQRKPLVGGFWSDQVYCPDLVHTPEAADIDRLVAKARREQRPLFIEFGHRDLALVHNPETVDRIENSRDFVLDRVFPGLEESQFTHYLFRYVAPESSPDP